MKKLLFFLFLGGSAAFAASVSDLSYTTNDGEVIITDCSENATGELAIPSAIGGKPVVSIGNEAFLFCSKLTIIQIGNGVTSIGRDAFAECTSLTSISIPDSVSLIGDALKPNVFINCDSLKTISVSAGNTKFTTIDGVLFNKEITLLGVYPQAKIGGSYAIPNSVVTIDRAAFYKCSNLTNIIIPDSVTSIGRSAFHRCNVLTGVTFLPIVAPSLDGNVFFQSAVTFDAPSGAIGYTNPFGGAINVDTDGDGAVDVLDDDDDNDGVSDNEDDFPKDVNETVDTDGDGIGNNADTDDDGDGVDDSSDAFPTEKTETLDTDGDGVGNNTDTDDDGDGLSDEEEVGLGTNPVLVDTDEDGVGDKSDKFPNDPSEAFDTDGDGIGNNADLDDDGDGVNDLGIKTEVQRLRLAIGQGLRDALVRSPNQTQSESIQAPDPSR